MTKDPMPDLRGQLKKLHVAVGTPTLIRLEQIMDLVPGERRLPTSTASNLLNKTMRIELQTVLRFVEACHRHQKDLVLHRVDRSKLPNGWKPLPDADFDADVWRERYKNALGARTATELAPGSVNQAATFLADSSVDQPTTDGAKPQLDSGSKGKPNQNKVAIVVLAAAAAAFAILGGVWWLTSSREDSQSSAPALTTSSPADVGTLSRENPSSSTDPVGVATIDSPTDGDGVGSPVVVRGTVHLEPGTAIWLLVQPPDGAFYLTARHPVDVDAAGNWDQPVTLGTKADDVGLSYHLHAVTVPVTGSLLQEELERGGKVKFDAMPEDATVLAHIKVTLTSYH